MLSVFERSSEVNVEVGGWPSPPPPSHPCLPQAIIVKPFSSVPALTILSLRIISLHDSRQSTIDIHGHLVQFPSLDTIHTRYFVSSTRFFNTPLASSLFQGGLDVFPPGSKTHKFRTPYYKETPTDIETGKHFGRLSSPY